MPTYGYQCSECKHEFQIFQSMRDDPISVCPECNGAVKRLMYPVGIVFKGSGWYINDSRKPEKSASAEGGGTSGDAQKNAADKSEAAVKTDPAPAKETTSTAA
ncbi:MAG TPA: FmdB family zinc ribbon protein [Chthonomonadales bacterium]|nr:FmdB family zinc ribbon protein [Chthonomonadales bacterium]